MKRLSLSEPNSPMVLIALLPSIPAFYLDLTGPSALLRNLGSVLYGLTATIMMLDLAVRARRSSSLIAVWRRAPFDSLIVLGALISIWPSSTPWSMGEWALRLAFCGIVFLRLILQFSGWIAPNRLLQTLLFAAILLAISGAGFYWLDPRITSYEDGLWLAFTTGATVGFGDLVPSTPASRIFSVFIVLLGYAVFSVVTASIAALFVGEDEKRIEREFHADIRSLRAEIAALRRELNLSKYEAAPDARIRPPSDPLAANKATGQTSYSA